MVPVTRNMVLSFYTSPLSTQFRKFTHTDHRKKKGTGARLVYQIYTQQHRTKERGSIRNKMHNQRIINTSQTPRLNMFTNGPLISQQFYQHANRD